MKIAGAALGNCVHTAGILNFLKLADDLGYETEFLGTAISVERLIKAIEEIRPDKVALSYRLSAEGAGKIFEDLKKALSHRSIHMKFLLGCIPSIVPAAKKVGIFEFIVTEDTPREKIISYLKGEKQISHQKHILPQNLIERIKHKTPYPLIRHHFGLPSLKETIRGARMIAKAGVLDILSLGPDQNAQESFFRPKEMDHREDGSGGVSLRRPEDLRAIYKATRCGNYPLLRCYSGTRDLLKWARMSVEIINNAWGAIPLSWYSQLDGRSDRIPLQAVKENQSIIRWYARKGIPVEVNESHQWSLRNASDTIAIATAFLAAYNAKTLGVRYYVSQYMFNTPPGISPAMDLAKMLSQIELVKSLHDKKFISFRMVRPGLKSLSTHPDTAKGQLAASIYTAMSLQPHIVHVVSFTEADHLARPEEIITACKIAEGVIKRCQQGLPDVTGDRKIIQRKKYLLNQAKFLLKAIRELDKNPSQTSWCKPEVLSRAIGLGLLDAPELKGNRYAPGKLITEIINGACDAIDPQNGRIVSEQKRIS